MLSSSRTSLISGNYDDVAGDFVLPELVKRRDTLMLNREDGWSLGLFITIIIGLLFMITGALLTFIFPGVFVLPVIGIGLIGLILVVSSASLLIRSYCFCREIKNRLKAVDLLLEYKESCISFNKKITQCYGGILDFRSECLVEDAPFLQKFRNTLIRYSNDIDFVTRSLQNVYTEEIKISDFLIGFKSSLAALHRAIDAFSAKSKRDLLQAAEILKRITSERRKLEDFMKLVEGHFQSLAISLTEPVPDLVTLLINRNEELSQIESAILTDSRLEPSDITGYQEILNRSDEVVKIFREQFNKLSIEGFALTVKEDVSLLKESLGPLLSKGTYLKQSFRKWQVARDLLGDSVLKISETQEQMRSIIGVLDLDAFCSDNWSQNLCDEILDLKTNFVRWDNASAQVRNDIIENKEIVRAQTVQMRLEIFLKGLSEEIGSFIGSSEDTDLNKEFVQSFIGWLEAIETDRILKLEPKEEILTAFLSDCATIVSEGDENKIQAICLKYSLPIPSMDDGYESLIQECEAMLIDYQTQLLAIERVSSLINFVSEEEDCDCFVSRVKEYMGVMHRRCRSKQKENDEICAGLQIMAANQEKKQLEIVQRLDMIQGSLNVLPYLRQAEECDDTEEGKEILNGIFRDYQQSTKLALREGELTLFLSRGEALREIIEQAEACQSFINLIRKRFSLERSALPSLLLSSQFATGQLLMDKALKNCLDDIKNSSYRVSAEQTSRNLGRLIMRLDQGSDRDQYSRLKEELDLLLESLAALETTDL